MEYYSSIDLLTHTPSIPLFLPPPDTGNGGGGCGYEEDAPSAAAMGDMVPVEEPIFAKKYLADIKSVDRNLLPDPFTH